MAHGGTPAWNAAVLETVAALDTNVPTTVAFGMADPATLTDGLRRLRKEGATRVAVVRLFLSGASFRHQTEYLLGLRDDPPTRFVLHGPASWVAPEPIDHGLRVATHTDGLSDAPLAARIVADRVRAAGPSVDESVLLLAHGMGDDGENEALLTRMRRAAAPLRSGRHHSVEVATLREDWPEKRRVAEERIRAFVATEAEAGRRVIVVPFRLFGAGPYPDVLEGLDHFVTEGLVPHVAVTHWIGETATRIACAEGWLGPVRECGRTVQPN